MTIGLKGLQTPDAPEERDIAYLEVVHNGLTYDWLAFVPRGGDVMAYINSIADKIYADIDAKEAKWAALEPKTRKIIDPMTGQEIEIPIQKEEIVKADNPDYYALRRAAYPLIGYQLDAIWKGPDSLEYARLQEEIREIKERYPKP